jgi:hypothetical protein
MSTVLLYRPDRCLERLTYILEQSQHTRLYNIQLNLYHPVSVECTVPRSANSETNTGYSPPDPFNMHLRIIGPIRTHVRSIQKATDKELGCENRKG